VARRALGEQLAQVAAHDVDHVAGRFLGDEQRDVGAVAHGDQLSGGVCASATISTGGSSVTMREMRRSVTSARRLAQVGHLAPADDLHAVRVDVVQVADQVGGRLRVAHGGFVEAALGVGVAGDPLPAQRRAVFLEQRLGADDGRLHAQRGRSGDRLQRFPIRDQLVHLGGVGFGLQALAQLAVAQHLGDFGQDLEVALGRRLGHQQEDQQATGSSSGRRTGSAAARAAPRPAGSSAP
jgi:hypothetical protein